MRQSQADDLGSPEPRGARDAEPAQSSGSQVGERADRVTRRGRDTASLTGGCPTSVLLAAVIVVLGATATGCGDPCEELEAQLCADLGSDCAMYRERGLFDDSFSVPAARGKGAIAQPLQQRDFCSMLAEADNYHGYTLPFIEYRIAHARDPRTRPPPLAPLSNSGTFARHWLLIGPLLLGLFAYNIVSWRRMRRRARELQHSGGR